jgi:hypothetical protein
MKIYFHPSKMLKYTQPKFKFLGISKLYSIMKKALSTYCIIAIQSCKKLVAKPVIKSLS